MNTNTALRDDQRFKEGTPYSKDGYWIVCPRYDLTIPSDRLLYLDDLLNGAEAGRSKALRRMWLDEVKWLFTTDFPPPPEDLQTAQEQSSRYWSEKQARSVSIAATRARKHD